MTWYRYWLRGAAALGVPLHLLGAVLSFQHWLPDAGDTPSAWIRGMANCAMAALWAIAVGVNREERR